MSAKYVLIDSGVKKTADLVKYSLNAREACQEKSILFLTYDPRRKDDIISEMWKENGYFPKEIRLKDWFEFLLEDMIRPFQMDFIENRISNVIFNKEYHQRNEIAENAKVETEKKSRIFPNHFFLKNNIQSIYASEVATKIFIKNKNFVQSAVNPVIDRLTSIYAMIIIDDADELIDWDFQVLNCILTSKDIKIICSGNFDLDCHQPSKFWNALPKDNEKNLQWFKNKGFEVVDSFDSLAKLDESSKNPELLEVASKRMFTNIKLYSAIGNELVNAKIFNDITYANLADWEFLWKPILLKLIANSEWSALGSLFYWPDYVAKLKNQDNYKFYSLVCNGITEGMMITSSTKQSKYGCKFSTRATTYVECVEVAPWNRHHSTVLKKFRGVGSELIRHAIEESKNSVIEGRLGIHSKSETEGFYYKLGMRDFGVDQNGLRYYELIQ